MNLSFDDNNTVLIVCYALKEATDYTDYGYWDIKDGYYRTSLSLRHHKSIGTFQGWDKMPLDITYAQVSENVIWALFVLLLGWYRK